MVGIRANWCNLWIRFLSTNYTKRTNYFVHYINHKPPKADIRANSCNSWIKKSNRYLSSIAGSHPHNSKSGNHFVTHNYICVSNRFQ